MVGTVNLPHTCPNCKRTTAHTAGELQTLFGFRTIPSGATNQSWCRECRGKSWRPEARNPGFFTPTYLP